MRVRYWFMADITEEDDVSEQNDVTFVGYKKIAQDLANADSCDDFNLMWEEVEELE